MPIPDAFQLIITRLIQATDERAVSWSEGPASLSYSTSLSSFSVTVQSMRPQGAGTAAFNAGQFNIQFSAVDSDGQVIDSFQLPPQDKDFPRLLNLYDGARRSARKIDDKISQMLKELDLRSKK